LIFFPAHVFARRLAFSASGWPAGRATPSKEAAARASKVTLAATVSFAAQVFGPA
jgi:hypothetical protein